MGFANIWATKAECTGKGQRRWCASARLSSASAPGSSTTRVFSLALAASAPRPVRARATSRG
jgi:hypothetical protein